MTYFIRLLGGLSVESDGRAVAVPAVTQRRALIFLAIHANETVSVDQLADGVWCTDVPTSIAHAVHSLVYRLRRQLEEDADESGADLIQRAGPGYRLTIEPRLIDSNLFTSEARRARRLLADEPAAAREILTESLGMWRGDALIDVAYDSWASAEIRRLTETRLGACETLADANIALGEPELAVAELESLTERFPLRESLWALLWKALAASGRHLDVTASHRRVVALLDDQFQMSPSEHLAELAGTYALTD